MHADNMETDRRGRVQYEAAFPLAEKLTSNEAQVTWGDYCNPMREELKTEREYTGNILVENISNYEENYKGWYQNLVHCESMFYQFLSNSRAVRFPMKEFRKWFDPISDNYKHICKKINGQPWHTTGWIVPIEDILINVPGAVEGTLADGKWTVDEH